MNARVSNLSTALASANAEVDKLRVHKSKLEERVKAEMEQGEKTVEVIQAEVTRSLTKLNERTNSYLRGAKIRFANREIEDEDDCGEGSAPMTPVSLVRFVDIEDTTTQSVEGSVEIRRGKESKNNWAKGRRRRRLDSGIGMGTLSEEDETDTAAELSSEADMTMFD